MDKAGCRSELLQEFVFGLWRLWKNRNNVIFNHCSLSPPELVECWRSDIDDYRKAEACRKRCQTSEGPGRSLENADGSGSWKKPIFGVLKINTDAAWNRASKKAGLGWVVRDFAGILQAAGGSGSCSFNSVAAAEAAAIREALIFCVNQVFEKVIIESDARSIIQMLRMEASHDFSLASLLSDIECLARGLKEVSFVFAPRASNKAAHSVAKFVSGKDRDFVWDAIGAEFLFNVLAQDINLPLRI